MRKTAQLITMAGTLALVAACVFGQRVTPTAAGMTILVTAPSGQVRRGELLATTNSEFFFLVDTSALTTARVISTRFSAGIELRNAPRWPGVRFRGRPGADDLEKLSFNSRYPLGLDDSTMSRLLAALDQAEPEVWP